MSIQFHFGKKSGPHVSNNVGAELLEAIGGGTLPLAGAMSVSNLRKGLKEPKCHLPAHLLKYIDELDEMIGNHTKGKISWF